MQDKAGLFQESVLLVMQCPIWYTSTLIDSKCGRVQILNKLSIHVYYPFHENVRRVDRNAVAGKASLLAIQTLCFLL